MPIHHTSIIIFLTLAYSLKNHHDDNDYHASLVFILTHGISTMKDTMYPILYCFLSIDDDLYNLETNCFSPKFHPPSRHSRSPPLQSYIMFGAVSQYFELDKSFFDRVYKKTTYLIGER